MQRSFSGKKLSSGFLRISVHNSIVDTDATWNEQQNNEDRIIGQTEIAGVNIFCVHFDDQQLVKQDSQMLGPSKHRKNIWQYPK